MISHSQHPPVRPPQTNLTPEAMSSTDAWHPETMAQEEDAQVNLEDADGEPIVGIERDLEKEDPGVTPRPVSSPKPMTATQREIHDLTHQPPDPDCPICASSRTPNITPSIPVVWFSLGLPPW